MPNGRSAVTVWAGVLIVETVVGYVVGFMIVYAVFRWVLERYFKGKSETSANPQPPFGSPQK